MADHTDFLRIRGLESAETEVFQGMGAASLTVSGPGGGGNTGIEWGEIPENVFTMISKYTNDSNEWLKTALAYNADSGSRSLPPALLDALPLVPVVIEAVATGGASLPAAAVTLLAQVIMSQAETGLANYAESLDENSPTNLLKKAFLYDDQGELKSILGTGLLTAETVKTSFLEGVRKAIEALKYNDEVVDFGPFRLHLKGNVIEFGEKP